MKVSIGKRENRKNLIDFDKFKKSCKRSTIVKIILAVLVIALSVNIIHKMIHLIVEVYRDNYVDVYNIEKNDWLATIICVPIIAGVGYWLWDRMHERRW